MIFGSEMKNKVFLNVDSGSEVTRNTQTVQFSVENRERLGFSVWLEGENKVVAQNQNYFKGTNFSSW